MYCLTELSAHFKRKNLNWNLVLLNHFPFSFPIFSNQQANSKCLLLHCSSATKINRANKPINPSMPMKTHLKLLLDKWTADLNSCTIQICLALDI